MGNLEQGQSANLTGWTTAQEALWRSAAFADAGADILFIDALESEEEMRSFCAVGGSVSRLPKVPFPVIWG